MLRKINYQSYDSLENSKSGNPDSRKNEYAHEYEETDCRNKRQKTKKPGKYKIAGLILTSVYFHALINLALTEIVEELTLSSFPSALGGRIKVKEK